MLDDPIHWRKLVREYSTLAQLPPGVSPQARGQRFNGLIAELFTAFGIQAESDRRSVGEIDVVFRHAGRYFILEAKWVQGPASFDPIAKLQRRVEQRMAGVTGVFLSMDGYTKHALADIDKGRRLDLVLLDREHWEAMLSGFVPPAELLDLVTARASYDGSAYTPLRVLLDRKAPVPDLNFGGRAGPGRPDFRAAADHVRVEAATADFESGRLGVSADHDGTVLVTAENGVLSVDLGRAAAAWAAPVSGCDGNAVRSGTGILVHRAHGVGRCANGAVGVVSAGGAAGGRSQLVPDGRGAVWCFDPGSVGRNHDAPATMSPLDGGPGAERGIPYRPGAATGATWVNGTELVVAGDPDFVLVPESGEPRRWTLPSSHPVATVAIDSAHTLSLAEDASLWATEVRTGRSAVLGRVHSVEVLDGRLSKDSSSSVHLAVRYRGPGGKSRVSLMRVRSEGPWLPARLLAETGSDEAARAESEPVAVPEAVRGSQGAEAAQPAGARAAGVPLVSSEETRLADRRRGEREAASLAEKLPLHVLEGAMRVSFDVVRWLKPWREHWRGVVSGQAPVLPDWLPAIAHLLGSYAAPEETLESHFTPTPPYVLGFSAGLREVWTSLVQRGLVPGDVNVLSQWLVEPTGVPARPRGSMTPKEVRAQSYKEKGRTSWMWALRIALWLATLFFGLSAIGSIGLTATGGWPDHSVATVLGGNLVTELPFLGLLTLVIFDVRRRRRKAKRG
ncbi:restriction endonuclease [Amycolatopsis sp. cg9]|uniref:restriction endonuclease n=1 Tax=Amycolatopsis sp. cg9 TaxID=3238801 RepID=UPI003526745C